MQLCYTRLFEGDTERIKLNRILDMATLESIFYLAHPFTNNEELKTYHAAFRKLLDYINYKSHIQADKQ